LPSDCSRDDIWHLGVIHLPEYKLFICY
jgi:hypothetical protein